MYYGSIKELIEAGDQYGSNHINGKCSNCGECCVDLLPMTPAEVERVKEYAKKHGLKEHHQAPFFDLNAIDLSCPFRNQQTKKCEIYAVRPYICRSFICSKTIEDAHRDRDLIHRGRSVHSLRYEVFGNPTSMQFFLMTIMHRGGAV